jgi:hypothetical protein
MRGKVTEFHHKIPRPVAMIFMKDLSAVPDETQLMFILKIAGNSRFLTVGEAVAAGKMAGNANIK